MPIPVLLVASSSTAPRRSRRKARSLPSSGRPRRGRQAHSDDLKKGDRVLFGKWSGTEVKIDGQDLLIMKESHIMGVLQETVAKKKAA